MSSPCPRVGPSTTTEDPTRRPFFQERPPSQYAAEVHAGGGAKSRAKGGFLIENLRVCGPAL